MGGSVSWLAAGVVLLVVALLGLALRLDVQRFAQVMLATVFVLAVLDIVA